jgi:hypothetical protein
MDVPVWSHIRGLGQEADANTLPILLICLKLIFEIGELRRGRADLGIFLHPAEPRERSFSITFEVVL